jgi:hypothetical protein
MVKSAMVKDCRVEGETGTGKTAGHYRGLLAGLYIDLT